MEMNLKDLSNETLYELIKVSVDILKERSNATHSNELLKKSSDDHSNAITEKKKTIKRPYKKNRRKPTKNFTELDTIVTKYHGKKSYKEIIEIAAEKGITTNDKQIDYRRRTLGLSPKYQRAKPKKTDDEYLKSIEERDHLDLKGTENPKNLNEAEGDD